MNLNKLYQTSLCVLLLMLLHRQVAAQEPVTAGCPEKDSRYVAQACNLDTTHIHTKVGVIADFNGGSKAWFDYAQRHFDFSYVAMNVGDKTRRFQDSIVLQFIVTKEGRLCDFTTLRGNKLLEAPVFALLNKSPRWQPSKAPTGRDLDAYRTLRVDVEMDFQKQQFTIMQNNIDFYRKNDR